MKRKVHNVKHAFSKVLNICVVGGPQYDHSGDIRQKLKFPVRSAVNAFLFQLFMI